MALALSERGYFTWPEWSAALAEEIGAADLGPTDQSSSAESDASTRRGAALKGKGDDGTHYYEHWLATLERLATAKGLTDVAALLDRKHAWADAYRHTPHGKPVVLP